MDITIQILLLLAANTVPLAAVICAAVLAMKPDSDAEWGWFLALAFVCHQSTDDILKLGGLS